MKKKSIQFNKIYLIINLIKKIHKYQHPTMPYCIPYHMIPHHTVPYRIVSYSINTPYKYIILTTLKMLFFAAKSKSC